MNSDILKGRWKQLAGRAKATWGALTDDDWLRIEGDTQKFAGRIQERYGLTREQAERQVADFVERYGRDTGQLSPGGRDTRNPDISQTV